MAKAGGSPRCCPVLCGLRDRCIAAMLATRKRRDTKAELNRRNQACEVLIDTGIRVARKWLAEPKPRRRLDEHQGSAPCIPVWKTGVYLSTLMLGEMQSRAGIAPASAVLQNAA